MWGAGFLPKEFYLSVLKKMLPQLGEGYLLIFPFFLVVLMKGIFVKSEEVFHAGLWLIFALSTVVLPIFARLPIYMMFCDGKYESMLHDRYFYYPTAAISIAFGALLGLSPITRFNDLISARAAKLLTVSVCMLAIIVAYPSTLKIRAHIAQTAEEDLLFADVVDEYKVAMLAFLGSPAYSPDEILYFEDGLLDRWYPHNWLVTKSIIFKLYFDHIENVRFVDMKHAHGKMHQWTSEGVLGPECSGRSLERPQDADE
jgi:hypothetical protein